MPTREEAEKVVDENWNEFVKDGEFFAYYWRRNEVGKHTGAGGVKKLSEMDEETARKELREQLIEFEMRKTLEEAQDKWNDANIKKFDRDDPEEKPPNPIPLPKGQEGYLCPDCGTRLKNSPDGPWCEKCEPDAPRKFHLEEANIGNR